MAVVVDPWPRVPAGSVSLVVPEIRFGDGFWQAVVDSVPANVAVVDRAGVIRAVNEAWRRFGRDNGGGDVGAGVDYLAVCDAAARVGDVSAAEAAQLIRDVIAGREVHTQQDYACDSPDVPRRFVMLVWPHIVDGGIVGAVILHFDVTEQEEQADVVRAQAQLLDQVDAAVVALTPDRAVRFWSKGAERLLGWSAAEVVGREVGELWEPRPGAFAPALEQLLREGAFEGIVDLRAKDGSLVPVQMRNRAIRDGDGSLVGLSAVATDARIRLAHESELRSARDYLRAAMESVPEGLFTVRSDGTLIEMNPEAERLLGWTAAELAGQRMHEATHCEGSYKDCPITVSRRERRTIEVPEDMFRRKDGTCFPVSYKASNFETPDGLQGTVVVFRDVSAEQAERARHQRELLELSWAARIREALDRDELVLHAQPIVDLETGEQVQHELLLRMHWDGRVVLPGEFLPAAERHGLLGDIDRWVATEACRCAAHGRHVHLNVSGPSLSRPEFLDHLERELRRTGADPRLLVVEITETTLVEDEQAASQTLERLNDLGCRIALDDFGTGYGSLTFLKRLPVHFLKIDREFVADIRNDPSNVAVVRAVVNLARAFGQQTIAEGVEDEETMALLGRLEVDYAQGYFLGRPRPLTEVFGQL